MNDSIAAPSSENSRTSQGCLLTKSNYMIESGRMLTEGVKPSTEPEDSSHEGISPKSDSRSLRRRVAFYLGFGSMAVGGGIEVVSIAEQQLSQLPEVHIALSPQQPLVGAVIFVLGTAAAYLAARRNGNRG